MADAFLLLIRWLHTIAAVAWVGGGIFYWVVLRPAVRAGDAGSLLTRFAGQEFGQLVTVSLWTLVITGGILAFDALAQETGTVAYFSVLAAKVALVGWMFFIIVGRRRGGAPPSNRGLLRRAVSSLGSVNTAVLLGIIVLVLSDVLRWLVQRGLST